MTAPAEKTILSLCDFSGAWAAPYRAAGYSVIQVDPKLEHREETGLFLWRGTVADVLRSVRSLPPIHGILAAPPCTDFSLSGAQYWPAKDKDGTTAAAVQIVRDCLAIKNAVGPKWWALENPRGRINKLVPELGRARYSFDPCDYGDPYTKKTLLWGRFTPPLPLILGDRSVDPVPVNENHIMRAGGKSEKTKAIRSNTPPGFASAFFEVNP